MSTAQQPSILSSAAYVFGSSVAGRAQQVSHRQRKATFSFSKVSNRPAMSPNLPFFIPSLHKLSNPSISNSPSLVCLPPQRHSLSPIPRRAPLAIIAPSRPSTSQSPNQMPQPKSPRRVGGHKHTAESKRKISLANRGNTPWNKGRRHTEETKRKIAESTRRAMLQPGVRDLLRTRAIGRKHTEATRIKIRETAMSVRGGVTQEKKKRRAVPFVFGKEVVRELNVRVQQALEEHFTYGDGKLISREKRPMSVETRDKLSKRIKEMWGDPLYRDKVMRGVEVRAQRLRYEKEARKSDMEESSDGESGSNGNWASAESTVSKRNRKEKMGARDKRAVLEGIQMEDPSEGSLATASPVDESTRRKDSVSEDPLVRNIVGDEETKQSKPKSGKRKRPKGKKRERDNVEIVLDEDSLQGLTKEDLGIFGTHTAGPIQLEGTSPFTHPEPDSVSPASPFADIDIYKPISETPGTLGDFDLPDFNFDIFAEADLDLPPLK